MESGNIELSRISKFFVDRDQTTADEALARRRDFGVTLVCGADVGCSYVLQLAVMTAVSLANRCFPGAVRIVLDEVTEYETPRSPCDVDPGGVRHRASNT